MRRGWTLVLLYSLSIYGVLPFARDWQRFFRQQLGANFSYLINFSILTVGLLPLWWLGRRLTALRFAAFIGLVLVSFAAAMQIGLPEERIHLVQYGILGYLCASAASSAFKGAAGFALVILLGLLIGLGDELIQGVLPSRVFDWWDVSYNLGGVSIGLLVFQIIK